MKSQTQSVARFIRRVFFSFGAVVFLSAMPIWAQTYSPIPASTNNPALNMAGTNARAMSPSDANVPGWITQPLSIVDALNLTLKQNSGLVKARADLESSRGLVIQTRAVALPNVSASGKYTYTDPGAIQQFPFGNSTDSNGVPVKSTNSFTVPNQSWNAGIQIVQNIYTGGRLMSALRAAKLQKEQSMLQYQSAVEDALLATRVAYYDVLVAEQQITVNEASVALLTRELEDQQRRFDAGTVPRFNVLQ
ncbi:MAG TPA: TolC family protein, partial [Verrucomicrobiae bacterium]|nr:TolC family protein [Verrucomicrobiae bacterium]